MKPSPAEVLTRIIDALEADLIAATDEDIAAVAADLGMKPHMKGSVALFDLIAGGRFGDVAIHLEAPGEQDNGTQLPPDDETSPRVKERSHRDH